jgi:hypothetical protein
MNETELKQKYNSLLADFKTGAQYLVDHPEKEEAAQKRLDEISEELSNIMNALPEMTQEEKENGFKLEQVSEQVEKPKQMIVKQTSNQVATDFKTNWAIAEKLSKSSLLPAEFQEKPENVIIALGMAQKLDLDFFTVAQNLHLIKGRLSWSGSFCKTLIEKTGQYKDLDLIYVGEEGKDNFGCYLEATRIRDNKRIKGNTVTVELAKKEGWWSKKDKYGNETSKWSTMTSQMLGYRAMAFFARLYTPEALNGVMTSEESMDLDYQKEQPKDIL